MEYRLLTHRTAITLRTTILQLNVSRAQKCSRVGPDTLWRQTVGGVINYVTPNPPADWSGSLTVVGGNRDYFNGHVNYGGTWKKTGLLFGYTRKQGRGRARTLRSGMHDFNFKSVTTVGDRQAVTAKFNYYGEDSQVTYSGLTEAEYLANPRQNPFRNDHFYGRHFDASVTHAFVFNPDVG